VLDRVAEHVQRLVKLLDLRLIQFGAFLEGREPGLPEDLVDPGAADAGDIALVAEQGVEVAGLGDQSGELIEWRRRPGFGPEPGGGLVVVHGVARQQLRPGSLLGAELAQAQLAAVLEADQDSRGTVLQRGAFVEDANPAR
jgi:hypothetical protein